jgi:hypothetical protein
MSSASGNPNALVTLAYPNAGAWSQTQPQQRCVLLTHGHFIEEEYRLMSVLREFLGFGGPVSTIRDLEEENSQWIDFVWSTLGGAGKAGRDVGKIYTRLQDAAATERLIGELTERLVAYLKPRLPMSGERNVRVIASQTTRALLDAIVQRSAELERNSYFQLLSGDSIAGLGWYLDTPVANQIRAERSQLPADLVCIFGHTHKPFEDALALASYELPVRIFNTGCWVVDEPVVTPLEGASAVLVDDQHNVVSLRLFNQSADGVVQPAYVPASGAYPVPTATAPNPLLAAVETALAQTTARWTTFASVVGAEIARYQSRLLERDDPEADAPLAHARGMR